MENSHGFDGRRDGPIIEIGNNTNHLKPQAFDTAIGIGYMLSDNGFIQLPAYPVYSTFIKNDPHGISWIFRLKVSAIKHLNTQGWDVIFVSFSIIELNLFVACTFCRK